MKKRVYAYYEGGVQGIGFRFTAQHIAESLKLSGWVRNLPDGNVELIAEGEEADLQEFLSNIKEDMGRYIRKDIVEWQAFEGKFHGFNIRF